MRCSAAPAAAACFALVVQASGDVLQGTLTTWLSVSATPMDGSCEFMRDPINSTTDPMLAAYLRQGMHCSIGQNSPAYRNGETCGACYRVRSTSDEGSSGDATVQGAASEAIVTVSTGGINGTGRFDCFPEAFEAITGATMGEFDIEFEQVECDAIQTTPSVTSFEEKNPYYCKMVFNNIAKWGTLSSVEACLESEGGSDCREMTRLSGQAWQNCPQGSGDKIPFFLTQQDPSGGQSDTVECICEGEWPWEQGESCTCGVNFGGITLSETSTTVTATATSTTLASGEAPDVSGDGSEGSSGDGSSDGSPAPALSGAAAAGRGALAAAAAAVLGVLAAVLER